MKTILLFFILAHAFSINGQKTIQYSDSALTIAPIIEFDKYVHGTYIRQWLDTIFLPITDSLGLKIQLPGEYNSGAEIIVIAKNKILPVKMFDDITKCNAISGVRDSSMYFRLHAGSTHRAGYISIGLHSNNLLKGFTSESSICNEKYSTDWFTVAKKGKREERAYFKMKECKLILDTLPAYNNNVPHYREDFEIKGNYNFVSEKIYYHKNAKDKKGKPCYIKGSLYFVTSRFIHNTAFEFDDNGNIIKTR